MATEEQFWNWFKENEAKFYFLGQVDDHDSREALLDELMLHIHGYCDELYFEVGGLPDEKQDLIITAQGKSDFFPKVDSLVDAAPSLEHWNIIAFKPAVGEGIIEYNDIRLDSGTMFFIPLENPKEPQSIGIRVYTDNYDDSRIKEFRYATYLVLDDVLGEKSFALDIDYVDVKATPPIAERESLIELNRLPSYVAWKKSKSNPES
jgi:hypothetical protein